jgi:hypothetical protein
MECPFAKMRYDARREKWRHRVWGAKFVAAVIVSMVTLLVIGDSIKATASHFIG